MGQTGAGIFACALTANQIFSILACIIYNLQILYMPFFQKEIISKTEHQNSMAQFSEVLATVHKVGFVASCALYSFSTFFSFSYYPHQNQHLLIAKQLLFNFAIVLAISEACQLAGKIKTVTKFEVVTYLVTLSGCILLGLTSLYQEGYNQGPKYMVSSFLLSVSNQFKIIRLLLPKNRLKEQRNRFMLQLSCCLSSIIFFFGAVIKETGLQTAYSAQLCPTLNLLSGVVMAFSILYMCRQNDDKGCEGYEGLDNLRELE